MGLWFWVPGFFGQGLRAYEGLVMGLDFLQKDGSEHLK